MQTVLELSPGNRIRFRHCRNQHYPPLWEVELYAPVPVNQNSNFNCQLLLSMNEHAIACHVWGDTVQKVTTFQQGLKIGQYYLVYKYGVNQKTYGKDLPHTTITSLSIQDFNKLIPLEVVLKPIIITQGDTDQESPASLPRNVFPRFYYLLYYSQVTDWH